MRTETIQVDMNSPNWKKWLRCMFLRTSSPLRSECWVPDFMLVSRDVWNAFVDEANGLDSLLGRESTGTQVLKYRRQCEVRLQEDLPPGTIQFTDELVRRTINDLETPMRTDTPTLIDGPCNCSCDDIAVFWEGIPCGGCGESVRLYRIGESAIHLHGKHWHSECAMRPWAERRGEPMKSSTDTLIAALRVLAADIQSADGVANAAIAEAADRLEQYHSALLSIRNSPFQNYENTSIWSYGTGVADGHRSCANTARVAIGEEAK